MQEMAPADVLCVVQVLVDTIEAVAESPSSVTQTSAGAHLACF